MKPLLALGAACIACCAIPVVLPLLAGLMALPLLASTEVGIAAVAVAAAASMLLLHRGQTKQACASDSSCACSGSILSKMPPGDGAAPIACTLTPGDLKLRLERFRRLAERALLSVRREQLRLHLVYATQAAQEVRDLVREEKSCCAFLEFDVREQSGGIHVTITAPEEAREGAQQLFALFAPDFAQGSRQKELVAS